LFAIPKTGAKIKRQIRTTLGVKIIHTIRQIACDHGEHVGNSNLFGLYFTY